ncbi:protein phosphatase 2C domain-containing protein [Myxococcota bacterium]|nr:protein phosphatase 2C domain-containing protein [Myxococcota bacterium]
MDARVVIGSTCSVGIGPEHGGRSQNEDNFLVALRGSALSRDDLGELRRVEAVGNGVMVAVADGMGGHEQGEVASAAAVQALAQLWQRGRPRDAERALAEWLPAAHSRARERLVPTGRVNLGSTLTAAWILGDRLGWIQVGDSRLYRLRSGTFWRLTRDQTHGEFAQRDRREAGPNASYPAQSFIYGSRGLGHDHELRLDPGLDSGTFTLSVGDRLLLCTDGLCGFVPDDRIAQVLARSRDPQEAADDLVDLAVESGSDDNVTAVVVHVRSLPIAAPEEEPSEADDDTLVPWDD